MSHKKYRMNQESELAGNVAWFLTGALIGTAVAVLFAPKTGKETRQYLAEKAQKSTHAVTNASNNITEAGKDMFDRGRKLVEDAADLFDRGRKLVKG